jgi:hypothetical protein
MNTSSEGAWRSDHPVLGGEAAASAVLRPPFYLDFSISKSTVEFQFLVQIF